MRSRGFTLIELMVVITIIGILVALSFPATSMALRWGHQIKSLSNMRQVGIGINLYSQENNNAVPGRGEGDGNNKWPAVVAEYVQDTSIFVDVNDPESLAATPEILVSNNGNRTAFLMNGFNDMGAYTNSSFELNLARLKDPSNIILLGQKKAKSRQYYMDFVEGPHGNQNDVLDKKAFDRGSNYVFADGSARFIREKDYKDDLWVINKDYSIPSF